MNRLSRRRLLPVLVVLLAGAITSYALASSGSPASPWAPTVSCQSGGLLRVAGHAPNPTITAYLLFANGASLSDQVTHASYSFELPAQLTNGPPRILRLVDQQGRIHDLSTAGTVFSRCTTAPRPVANPPLRFATAPSGHTPLDRAIALINTARQIAQRTSPACGQEMVPPPRLTISNGSPPAAILAVLGVLRRPQTPADRVPDQQLAGLADGPPGVLTIYRRYTRVIHEPGGITARIIVGAGEESLPKMALYPCMRAATTILMRLLHGQPPAVRRIALKIQRSYKLGPQTMGFHPWLNYGAAGGTGGPFDPGNFRAHGLAIEGCGVSPPPPGFNPPHPTRQITLECDVNGLAPDGVATVTLKLTGEARYTNLFGKPSDYYRLHPYTRTVRVRDNAWAFPRLPADPASAARQALIWRDGAGRILHIQSP